jgi:hypothetical protein
MMESVAMHGVIGRRREKISDDWGRLLFGLGAGLLPVILAVLMAVLRYGSAVSVSNVLDALGAAGTVPM